MIEGYLLSIPWKWDMITKLWVKDVFLSCKDGVESLEIVTNRVSVPLCMDVHLATDIVLKNL
jgi:hypothetical protein